MKNICSFHVHEHQTLRNDREKTQETMTMTIISATSFRGCNRFSPLLICLPDVVLFFVFLGGRCVCVFWLESILVFMVLEVKGEKLWWHSKKKTVRWIGVNVCVISCKLHVPNQQTKHLHQWILFGFGNRWYVVVAHYFMTMNGPFGSILLVGLPGIAGIAGGYMIPILLFFWTETRDKNELPRGSCFKHVLFRV